MKRMLVKLIVDTDTRLVLGAHILGPDAGEMAQLLGIALKAGLTKEDFDQNDGGAPDRIGGTGDDVCAKLSGRNGARVGLKFFLKGSGKLSAAVKTLRQCFGERTKLQ